MLPELKLVRQRYQAVLEVLAGATVSSVAHRSQVARRTVHMWLGRDAAYGPGWPIRAQGRCRARTR
jgi:transposase